jgi:hypothetical protein
MYKFSLSLALACTLIAGCRDEGGNNNNTGGNGSGDMAMTGPVTMPSNDDMAMPAMKTYNVSTVAAMRGAGMYGTFELDNVVVLGVNPSGSRTYVQDAAGNDLSAIVLQCPPNSMTHPCSLGSTIAKIAAGHQVTVKGTYEKGSAAKGNYETFYIDTLTDGGAAAAMPAATVLTMADVQKGAFSDLANSRKHWFQKVKVTLTDALVMFDLSPAEFKTTPSQGKSCPNQFGFGMVPMTGAPAAAPSACDATCAQGTKTTAPPATCTQPAASTTTDAGEILIGTDFYKGFTYSTDCKCYAGFSDTAVLATNAFDNGAVIQGILIYDSPPGGTGYLYLAPTSNGGATPDFKFTK